MMKKVFVILLAVLQIFTLVSCSMGNAGKTEDIELMAGTTEPTSEAEPSESAEKPAEDEVPGETTEAEPSEATDATEAVTESSVEATEPTTEEATQPSTAQNTTPTVTEPPHQHSYTSSQFAASCEGQGYTLYTCSCGKSYSEGYADALGHSYTDMVIAPTSTEQGYTEHTCSRCGNSYRDSYTEPVKVRYSAAEAQQIGNAYIASIGAVVTPELVTAAVHGYYPPESVTGYELDIVGGQEWLNNSAVGNIQATVTRLLYMVPDSTITGCHMYCSVTYDEASDTYTITVYYG